MYQFVQSGVSAFFSLFFKSCIKELDIEEQTLEHLLPDHWELLCGVLSSLWSCDTDG